VRSRLRGRELRVEVLEVRDSGEGGHLVDDDVGFAAHHGARDRCAIEAVGDDRVGAGRAQPVRFLR